MFVTIAAAVTCSEILPLYLQGSQEDRLLVDLIGEEEKRQRWIDLKSKIDIEIISKTTTVIEQ